MHELRNSVLGGDGSSQRSPLVEKGKSRTAKAGSLGSVEIPRAQGRATHQREEDRFSSINETASATWRDATCEVTIKNISSKGVQIKTEKPANIGEVISLTISDCDPINCEVRWVRDGAIGLEFVAETQLLAETGVVGFVVESIKTSLDAAGEGDSTKVGVEQRAAAERHGIVWLGSLRIGEKTCTARIRNISKTGAMVHWEGSAEPCKGDRATLDLGSAGKIKGTLKWTAGHETGIAFDEDYDVSRLAKERATHTGVIRETEAKSSESSVDERVGRAMRNYSIPTTISSSIQKSRLTLEEVYATLYPDGRPEEEAETDLAG